MRGRVGRDRRVELRAGERFVHADHIAGGGRADHAGARLDLQRTGQHDQDRGFAAARHGFLAGRDRHRPGNRREPPQLRGRGVREQRARLQQQHAIDGAQVVLDLCPSVPARACRESACGRSPRSCDSIIMRKMPSASSTFSDSSARKSSADSDSVIDGSAAVTAPRIGAPSSSSSTPSAAGARDVLLAVGAGHGDPAVEQELHGWTAAPRAYSVRPVSWRTWRPSRASRNSSSTCVKSNSGTRRRRSASSTAGSGSCHSCLRRSALHPVGGQRPRRRFEHVLIAHVAMREHVLEIVGQRPQAFLLDQQHRRRGDRLILVVQQLRERVFDVARARPVDHVALADALLLRHLFDEQHHALARLRPRAGCRGTRWRAIATAHRRSAAHAARSPRHPLPGSGRAGSASD